MEINPFMKFIHFQSCEFVMGISEETCDDVEEYEKPGHAVFLSPFAIAATCVTRGEWNRFLLDSHYEWSYEREAAQRSPSLEHPAVFISWDDAMAFCNWKARQIGRSVRLPSEAEWEFVCHQVAIERKESQSTFTSWCEKFDDKNPIAQFSILPQRAEIFGVWEGVMEWCLDSFEEDAYSQLPKTDPVMVSSSRWKVVRGGSPLASGYPRCSHRGFLQPIDRGPSLGFRPVISEITPRLLRPS